MEVPTIQAPPPDLPNPYTLASRRPPGSRPVEIIGGGWGKFRDLQTGLFYFVNKANGEATYDRPGGNLGARPIGPPPSAAVDDKLHPNNNVDSSVSHFENVVNTTTAQGPGAVPASQKMGPPPPSQPLSPSSAPLAQPAHYYKLVQEVDMNLFVACRDGKPQKLLNDLIGADIDIEDDAFAEINRQWCARRDGSGWDVLPIYDSGSSTSFFWSANLKETTHKRNVYAAVDGDTVLHIAIKLDRRDLLEWLSTVRNLDLNVQNSEGLTASGVADELNRANMYTFYFVLR